MTTLKTSLLVALMATASLVTSAEARGGPEGRGPGAASFETLDLDGNGLLTLEELEARAEARFAAADTDGDGALSAEELAARAEGARAERLARMMDRLDANEDGVLQLQEMQAAREERRGGDPAAMFARIDTDADGAVSVEEFEAARDRMGERRGFGFGRRDG